jgi:amidase
MCIGNMPKTYIQFLKKDGLQGVRIGVFRYYTEEATADSQVNALFEKAILDLKMVGAEIRDPFVIPDFDSLTQDIWCPVFRQDIDHYLASLGDRAPYKTLSEIVKSGLYAPYIEEDLKYFLRDDLQTSCKDLYHESKNIHFRDAVLKAMTEADLDGFVYPTWSNPPRKVGDLESPAGDNSQLIPPHTGQPALTVPMGFTYKNLPAGLQIVGRMFGEPELIRIAYTYEQATKHRRPPEKFASVK